MKTLTILLTFAACGTDDPTGTVNDPRAVLCDTFRVDGYRQQQPPRVCYFDVSDLDWTPTPILLGTGGGPITIGGYCGPSCSVGGGPTFVDADTYKVGAINWTGDTESGVAVVIGGMDVFNTPASEWKCIFQRCSRTE